MSYFTATEFRSRLPDMADSAKYPDAMVTNGLAWFTALAERFVGVAFETRTYTDVLSGDGGINLVVLTPHVRSVTSVTINTVVDSGMTYTFFAGVVRRFPTGTLWPYPWLYGIDNISITYTAGYTATCPDDLKDAAMLAVRDRILTAYVGSGVSKRVGSASSDIGNMQYSMSGPDRPTGLPSVDEVLTGYRDRLAGFGFA